MKTKTTRIEGQTKRVIKTKPKSVPISPSPQWPTFRLEIPFSITFAWQNTSRTITLEKGEDILKFADIIKDLLLQKGILFRESSITT